MVARKTTTVKKTAAKKPVAKTKTTGASTTTKAAASDPTTTSSEGNDILDEFVSIIESGDLDFGIATIYEAVEQRLVKHEQQQRRDEATAKRAAAAKKPTEKKVSAPPRKSPPTKTVTPKPNTDYLVSDRLTKLAGARVEFVRFNKGDEEKSVVKMKDSRPGAPVGKQLIIPTSALTAVPASASNTRKRTAKK